MANKDIANSILDVLDMGLSGVERVFGDGDGDGEDDDDDDDDDESVPDPFTVTRLPDRKPAGSLPPTGPSLSFATVEAAVGERLKNLPLMTDDMKELLKYRIASDIMKLT